MIAGWSRVKRENSTREGWTPTTYFEPYTPPVIAPAPSLPTRNVPPPPPTPQANAANGSAILQQGTKAKPTPPPPPKRPAVRGKKPAPPPSPRDSAVSMSLSNGGSGRATPDSTDSGKAPSLAATDLASMIRARGAKMKGNKNDDDW